MNRIKGSLLLKIFVHIVLFFTGITIAISVYHINSYYNSYSSSIHSILDTNHFQSRYLKYVERVAVYINYREKGYYSNKTVDPSIDLASLFEEDNKIDTKPDSLEEQQKEFEYYHTVLNINNRSFLYYVRNLNTGKTYYSPGLEEILKEHFKDNDVDNSLADYLKSTQNNAAYLILNTKTQKYITNVNRNYQNLNDENLNWVMDYITDRGTNPGVSSQNDYIICTTITDDVLKYDDEFGLMFQHFNKLYKNYHNSIDWLPISVILFIVFFTLCIAICGYQKETNIIKLRTIDKWYLEFWCIFSIVGFLGLYWLMNNINDLLFFDFDANLYYIILTTYAVIYPFCMYVILSFIRRCKSNTIFTNSILYICIKKLGQSMVGFFQEKSLTYPLAAYFSFFILIQIIALFIHENPILGIRNALGLPITEGILLSIIGYIIFGYFLFRWAMDISKIRKETKGITEGNINNKIDTSGMSQELRSLGDYINNIGDGLSAAVDEKLRSERLKTELIANVSHDIKTPLTSIINYVDLLKKENFENETVKGYLDILSSKSWRLKTLIEDLVEASKASSGTINLNLESLNLVELIRQSLGEFEDKFIRNNLETVLTISEEPIFILADGRSTYRIIENIFSNANKYALAGTRIYIDIISNQDFVVVSVKNISATKLNINVDELMERFVRGDLSRNTEGSGLGLSIAKSLASLQDATFDIILDGDLFKAVIKFNRLIPS